MTESDDATCISSLSLPSRPRRVLSDVIPTPTRPVSSQRPQSPDALPHSNVETAPAALQLQDDDVDDTDSLLERLHEKERQFDARISALDETLLCAAQGQAARDRVITDLRAELERLHAQLQQQQRDRQRRRQQQQLQQQQQQHAAEGSRLLRCESQLAERGAALETAQSKLAALDAALHEKERRIRRLEKELQHEREERQKQQQEQPHGRQAGHREKGTVAEAVARRERARYEATLREIRAEVEGMERRYDASRREASGLADTNADLRAKLHAAQEELEARVSSALREMRRAVGDRRELEESALVHRASLARLLRLLAEVPEMRRCLRVGDTTAGEEPFVFVGYRTAEAQREPNTDAENQTTQPQVGWLTGTGVEDGIYGGTAQLQSYNVYLNGHWCRQLQEIIDDENYFLRRSRIRFVEPSEEQRRDGAPRVPFPNDVLQGRQHDKDFWIPYPIFVAAQKFKNRHCPSVRVESFYPFLIEMNRVWSERMKHRVGAVTQRQREQSRHPFTHTGKHRNPNAHMIAAAAAGKSNTYGIRHAQTVDGERCTTRLLSSSATALWQYLHALRREVRCRVTGRNSLELFEQYDQLARRALRELRAAEAERTALREKQRCYRRMEAARAGLISEPETDAAEEKETHTQRDERDGKRSHFDPKDHPGGDPYSSPRAHSGGKGRMDLASRGLGVGAAARLSASCEDLQQFLSALRGQLRLDGNGDSSNGSGTVEHIPAATLRRIMDGVTDFVEEVRREVYAVDVEESAFTSSNEEDEEDSVGEIDYQEDEYEEGEEEDSMRHSL